VSETTLSNKLKLETIHLIGWNVVQSKNSYQLEFFRSNAENFKVLVTSSNEFFISQKTRYPSEFILLKKSPLGRFIQVLKLYVTVTRPSVSIIAPSGRFAFVYLVLCKMFSVRTIAVEWGDLYEIEERKFLTKFFYLKLMRRVDFVWYKEPYMRKMLIENGVGNLHYLPNACPLQSQPRLTDKSLSYDFLWMNRNVTSRYPELLLNSLVDLADTREFRCLIMGLYNSELELNNWLSKMGFSRTELERLGIFLAPFGDPVECLQNSKFFVLLGDHIFGNNALLEAMSMGLVPLVNVSEGVDEIVRDGVSGLHCSLDIHDVKLKLEFLLDLEINSYNDLSAHCRQIVRSSFNTNLWQEKAKNLLKDCVNP
jgi:glycosyltransferase involved in cell wall biosynthesis